jgi:hypothetical protein
MSVGVAGDVPNQQSCAVKHEVLKLLVRTMSRRLLGATLVIALATERQPGRTRIRGLSSDSAVCSEFIGTLTH